MSTPFKKIIKNTKENEAWYKDKEKNTSDIKSRVCKNCKAPRPVDTNLTTCDYCGFKFMDINVRIKPDK
ncbi:hypothetical protein [Tenacibaculum sp. SDUM215027]|uniref:hypothetical protein n=1 Tax=Tenacibaculum sp. SDUM215027 TaxID=3422596 RepID=UPI003D32334B